MDWTFALSSLATLVAIVDPIGATAIFLAFFGERPGIEQRRAARITATTVLVTAVVAFLAGERLLTLFGISIAALKVTGGLIIASVGALMLRGALAASATLPTPRKVPPPRRPPPWPWSRSAYRSSAALAPSAASSSSRTWLPVGNNGPA